MGAVMITNDMYVRFARQRSTGGYFDDGVFLFLISLHVFAFARGWALLDE